MTWSSMPACARPVRILDKLTLSVSMDLPMRVSADFLTSERLMMIPLSNVYQCAFVFTAYGTLERAGLVDGKNLDGQFLIAAQRKCRRVHDFQPAHDGFVETDARITGGTGIFIGVGAVDAIDLGCLQDDFSTDFSTAQRGGRIGCKERVACAGGKYHYLALFEVAQGLGADVGLDHLVDVQGGLHASVDTAVLERVLQRQSVHDGSHHAHIVGGGTVHAQGAGRHAAKNIAATDHDGQFDAQGGDLGDFFGHAQDG